MAVSVDRRDTASVPTRRQETGKPLSAYVGTFLRYLLLTVVGLVLFAPFILAFFGTFKSNDEITAFPPQILPSEWHPENWSRAWNVEVAGAGNNIFARWFFNSIWLALVNMITQLFFCSLAAYAFARMRFPGRDFIFSFMLATMAIPSAVTLIPGFVFYARLRWINTYWPLIIPSLVVPFGIFLLTQFFKSVPKELEEAAFIDGSTRFRTYWNVVLPLSRPALITLAILQFQASWNNFTGPLLFLRRPQLMTLTVGLGYFQTLFSIDWAAILVGSMFNAIPILVIFFIFNRYYMQSGQMSGLAGQ